MSTVKKAIDQTSQCIKMLVEGHSQKYISEALGVSTSFVSNIKRDYKKDIMEAESKILKDAVKFAHLGVKNVLEHHSVMSKKFFETFNELDPKTDANKINAFMKTYTEYNKLVMAQKVEHEHKVLDTERIDALFEDVKVE